MLRSCLELLIMEKHLFSLLVHEPLPPSFRTEWQQKQLDRMLSERVNPIDGLSSRWTGQRWKVR